MTNQHHDEYAVTAVEAAVHTIPTNIAERKYYKAEGYDTSAGANVIEIRVYEDDGVTLMFTEFIGVPANENEELIGVDDKPAFSARAGCILKSIGVGNGSLILHWEDY